MKRQGARYALSLSVVVLLVGAFGLAPIMAGPTQQAQALRFQPGQMPNQAVISAAHEQAIAYLAALEPEALPEPEPEPEPEQQSTQAGQTTQPEQAVAVQPAPLVYSGGGSPEVWMSAAGIAPADWGYVDFIATKESGWNPNATNPSSGACGLIQAYPCSKVPGNGYDPVDNLRWANGYATARYGSWQGAYEFWIKNWWW